MKEDKTVKELLGQETALTEDEWDQLVSQIMDVAIETPDKAMPLYKAAYKKVQTWGKLSTIANHVTMYLKDKEWGQELCDEAVKKAENVIDNAIIAGIISDSGGLNNKELGKTLCGDAVEKADTALQYCIIAEIISLDDGLNDKVWAKEIFQRALDKAETDEMTESIKDSMGDYLEED